MKIEEYKFLYFLYEELAFTNCYKSVLLWVKYYSRHFLKILSLVLHQNTFKNIPQMLNNISRMKKE